MPWQRWITPVQGYCGITLASLAAGLNWGAAAGLGAAGALLLLDAWRPWRRPLPLEPRIGERR